MNLIYLHSHDTGRRVSPYGYAVDTPNLMRLAEGGVTFRRAFCAAPTCSPSRAALLTGESAHSAGMTGLQHRGFALARPERHLAATLRAAGYETAQVGINHVSPEPGDVGYARAIPTDSARAEHVAPAAADYLAEVGRRGAGGAGGAGGGPFFLDCGFVETHRTKFPPHDPRDDPRRQQPPAGLADTPETRLDAAHFASAARRLDRGVGTVLDALDAAGLAGDTLVLCTTDHGISFPRRKCNCTDGGLEVMLFLRGPGGDAVPAGLTGGGVCDALVSQIDLYPTLCRILNVDPPAWLQGRDLCPVLRGEAAEVNEEVFAEVTYHAAYEPQRAVRTGRHKLIRRYGDPATPVRANVDDGPSKSQWLDAGYADVPLPREALYDLLLDPLEQHDLLDGRSADRPDVRAAAADLGGRLDRWMERTADPLLAGPVPPPPGARFNTPDDRSPNDPSGAVGRRRDGPAGVTRTRHRRPSPHDPAARVSPREAVDLVGGRVVHVADDRVLQRRRRDRPLDRRRVVVAPQQRADQPGGEAVAAAHAVDDLDLVPAGERRGPVREQHRRPPVAAGADALAQRDRHLVEPEPPRQLPGDVAVDVAVEFSPRDVRAVDAEHALGVLLVGDADVDAAPSGRSSPRAPCPCSRGFFGS